MATTKLSAAVGGSQDKGADKNSGESSSAQAAQTPQTQGDAVEKVGDILRKERLTRRFTIESIAKDLKLNVGYLKALEAGDFAALPAAPYVRVYIKSLTKYLSLDSDAIMKQFYKEQGLLDDDNEATKIDVSVQKQERNPTPIIAVILVVALAVFAFIANQRGWLTPPVPQNIPEPPAVETPYNGERAIEQLATDEDSALAAMNDPSETGATTKAPPRP